MRQLDPIIHAPKRLQVMAMLYVTKTLEFAFLQSQLGVSASVLSKHMAILVDAGYVRVSKRGHGRSGSTSYAMTKAGECAYRGYRQALSELLGDMPNT